jgi:hypothetical protein
MGKSRCEGRRASIRESASDEADVCDGEQTFELEEELAPPLTIDVTLATGYRNG